MLKIFIIVKVGPVKVGHKYSNFLQMSYEVAGSAPYNEGMSGNWKQTYFFPRPKSIQHSHTTHLKLQQPDPQPSVNTKPGMF